MAEMNKCRICGSPCGEILALGKMPIANAFIADLKKKEYFYDLSVVFCQECLMVQLRDCVPPEMMFNEDYAYFSSISKAMEEHFRQMADEIADTISRKRSPFIVELGCNDGIMLKYISRRGIRHLGIEPSANVAAEAARNGVNVIGKFFNADTARAIRGEYGPADVICGANVMCHIENINSVFEGIELLLRDDGVLFFEDPYLYDILLYNSFDQIYDEHVYYYSGHSVSRLARRHQLVLFDMKPQDVHGGSMRYYIRKDSAASVSDRVKFHLKTEQDANLHKMEGYRGFQGKVDSICSDLKKCLLDIRKKGGRVVGYGATSKSTTLLNYSQIGPDLIDYISDTTPTKIGKFTPGTRIPIKSHDFFHTDSPPYALLLAWNHRKEILDKELRFRKAGGKFITFFPRLNIE
jgi:methylation protein EvaC